MENKTIKKADDIESKIIDNETLVLDPESGTFFKLNDTGTEIWNSADGKIKIKDIAKTIAEKYDADYREVLKDVVELVNVLENKKLIKIL